MTGVRSRFLLFALLCLTFAAPAHADKRVALVIGNSAYKSVTPLDNPKNDAALMAETLRGLGFTLVGGGAQLDLDKAGIDRAVQKFGAELLGADVGLFYYAGHGLQVRGGNYLVPVDANPIRETDIDFQMLDANVVLRQMEAAGTKLNLVILDACRNNPFGGRSLRAVDRGLAIMQAPEGTLISFATQPGAVARDGDDGDSPYTKALAQTMLKPGLDVFRAFNEVGLAVANATGGAQQPWVSLSPIKGDFYFVGPPTSSAAPPYAAGPGEAERAWAVAKDTTSQAVLEDFIRRFGDSFYATVARDKLEELKKKALVAVVAPPDVPQVAAGPCGAGPLNVALTARLAQPLSAAEECVLKPKDVFKECEKCPEMVVVPAGTFMMGSPTSEEGRENDEGPAHSVTIEKPFAVGRFAVTFDEWDACVSDGGCRGYQPVDQGWGRGRRPVINVSWDDAKGYAAWLSRKTGKTYRLLSEAEREYVTRAGTTTPFWWGEAASTGQANFDGTVAYGNGPVGQYRGQTLPVDSFAPNDWGLYQLHGNVWEWVEDCYHDSYKEAPTNGSAWTSGECGFRVLRGGSWNNIPANIRSADRHWYATDVQREDSGFRLARTL
jgi:formylglycine-generating enzyme required for sulfatase activity